MIWTGKTWVSSVRDRAVVPLMRAVVPSVRETWTPRAWPKPEAVVWTGVAARPDETELAAGLDEAEPPHVAAGRASPPESGLLGKPGEVVPSSDALPTVRPALS
jgi:hypothetical protein